MPLQKPKQRVHGERPAAATATRRDRCVASLAQQMRYLSQQIPTLRCCLSTQLATFGSAHRGAESRS
jgi:hypothetical protein